MKQPKDLVGSTWRSRRSLGGLLAGMLVLSPSLFAAIPVPPASAPTVTLLAPDPTALVGSSSGAFTLVRSGAASADLTVYLGISGTASNGVDYALIANGITIPAGFLAVDIPVQPLAVPPSVGSKSVVLSIQNDSAYLVGDCRRALVTIVSDTFNIPPPTITLTSPTDNSEFFYPAAIPISADVSELNGTIQSVRFYADDAVLGWVTNSPYALVWTNAHPGHHALFARAVDQFGRSTLSAPVHVTVTEILPVVKLLSPTNGMNFPAHADITLTADASEAGGSIQGVAFYANGRSLGVVTTTPYSLIWSNAPAGVYGIYAVATDPAGKRGYCSPVFINVSSRPRNPLTAVGHTPNR